MCHISGKCLDYWGVACCILSRDDIPYLITSQPIPTEKISLKKKNVSNIIISALFSKRFQDVCVCARTCVWYVCVRAHVCVCVCVCVWERYRKIHCKTVLIWNVLLVSMFLLPAVEFCKCLLPVGLYPSPVNNVYIYIYIFFFFFS